MSLSRRIALLFRTKANKALDRAEDPREMLDYSYERQLELLQQVRRGLADVATSRRRVELQLAQLQQSAAKLQGQAQQALAGGHEDLALQVADLGGYRRPADQRLPGEILVPAGERLLRLVLQFAGRQLQLGELQLDALAAGRHVRQPAAHLLHHLKLLLIGVIENLAGILGAVQRLIRLHPEQGGDAAADAHPGPLPLIGWRPWPDGTSLARR